MYRSLSDEKLEAAFNACQRKINRMRDEIQRVPGFTFSRHHRDQIYERGGRFAAEYRAEQARLDDICNERMERLDREMREDMGGYLARMAARTNQRYAA